MCFIPSQFIDKSGGVMTIPGANTPFAVGQKLFQINAKLTRDLMGVWTEEVRSYTETNVTMVRRLSESRSPSDLLGLQREYSELFVSGVREAVNRRAALVREAFEQAGGVMRGAFGGTQQALYEAAAQAATEAEDIADDVKDDLEGIVDASLTSINGVGPKLAEQLKTHGVVSLHQVAALDLNQISREEHPLHALYGRMQADDWVDQARALISAPPRA
jgi:predicted flap endonuclease-1-like 5' DNA nuclease